MVDTTGGSVFSSPDQVIAYAAGSTITPQDKADIAAAVLTAAEATPIHANTKEMNDATVYGNGSPSNLWRGTP
jgi:hypothetical protein